jgi:hypothetical protein
MLLPDDVRERPDSPDRSSERARPADLDGAAARIEARVRPLLRRPDREAAARILADVGALESAVADGFNPDEESFGPPLEAWRAATLEAARLFRWTRLGAEAESCLAARRLSRALALAARATRPRVVDVPGAASLAVDPAAYLDAATRFLASSVRLPSIVIGLREAGAALSAVVAAGLETGGRRAESFTVRAHGAADARAVRFDARVARRLALHAETGGWFLIVGDGPRKSGASFHAAACALNALGAGDEQIVLFPARLPDAASLASADVRRGWGLRRKVVAAAAPAALRLPGLGAPAGTFDHAGA